jgi:polysaccharide export outer membrane protein
MKCAVLCLCSVAVALTACSSAPLREDVLAQAQSDGRIAFDVVKVDDAVVDTVLAQRPPSFPERFKKYLPPPDLKLAIGDTVSIVIWESGSDGLFGTSLTELSFPAGAVAKLLTGQARAGPDQQGQAQDLTASPGTLGLLFGGAAAQAGGAVTASSDFASSRARPSQSNAAQGFAGLADQPLTFSTAKSETTPNAASADLPAELAAEQGNERAPRATPGQAANAAFDLRQREAPRTAGELQLEDLLKVAAQSGRAGTRIPDQPVDTDGKISIPFGGRIEAAGRTPLELQHLIEERLAKKALDPQALVVVKRSAVNSVSVTGEVIGGKRIPLSPGGDRLLAVIAAAGGAKAAVHDTFVQLSRGGVTSSVPLATLVADPGQDIFAEPGDVLTLVTRPQTYSVFGATAKNAALTFTTDRLSLSEALGKAGGLLDNRADPRAVFLFRYEPVSLVTALGQPIATEAHGGFSPVVYQLDLSDAKSYLLARRFPVRDKDVIFVTDAESKPIENFFNVLSTLSGPITSTLSTCIYFKTC